MKHTEIHMYVKRIDKYDGRREHICIHVGVLSCEVDSLAGISMHVCKHIVGEGEFQLKNAERNLFTFFSTLGLPLFIELVVP